MNSFIPPEIYININKYLCKHLYTYTRSYGRLYVTTRCTSCNIKLLKRNVVTTSFKVVKLEDGEIYCTECEEPARNYCF
jgi:hypothetical protein